MVRELKESKFTHLGKNLRRQKVGAAPASLQRTKKLTRPEFGSEIKLSFFEAEKLRRKFSLDSVSLLKNCDSLMDEI